MNFKHMPELDWRAAYAVALTAMLTIGLVAFVILRRARWL